MGLTIVPYFTPDPMFHLSHPSFNDLACLPFCDASHTLESIKATYLTLGHSQATSPPPSSSLSVTPSPPIHTQTADFHRRLFSNLHDALIVPPQNRLQQLFPLGYFDAPTHSMPCSRAAINVIA